jgi:acylpyruvate hydrolase
LRLVALDREDGKTAAAVLADRAAAIISGGSYPDVGALLADGERGMERAREALSSGPFEGYEDAELLRPVLSPGATVCVGLNYKTHILEMGRKLPSSPTYFAKLPRALADPFAEIPLPAVSDRVDYEGELAVVIGRGGRNVPEDEAWGAVAGFTILNDVSMRDYQYRTLQWFAGKNWEASTPVGPAVVTPDELDYPWDLELIVKVNGDERQHAQVSDLVFDVPALVADLSKIITLRPGDIIATGTPGGVGEAMKPKRYLTSGDVVEVAIANVGSIRNRFVAFENTKLTETI